MYVTNTSQLNEERRCLSESAARIENVRGVISTVLFSLLLAGSEGLDTHAHANQGHDDHGSFIHAHSLDSTDAHTQSGINEADDHSKAVYLQQPSLTVRPNLQITTAQPIPMASFVPLAQESVLGISAEEPSKLPRPPDLVLPPPRSPPA
jgi:hypothetical protein